MTARAQADSVISPGPSSHSSSRRASRLGLARREMLYGYAFLSPALILFVVFIAGPLLGAIALSFYKWDLFTPREFVGLQNYRDLRDDRVATIAIRNSFVFAFWSIVLHMTFARSACIHPTGWSIGTGRWRPCFSSISGGRSGSPSLSCWPGCKGFRASSTRLR